MLKIARKLVWVVVAVGGWAVLSRSAEAASYDHVDRLAVRLQSQSSKLYWEFRTHFRHAAHSNHLMADAAKIYRLAEHLHDVAHTGGLRHIQNDLADLDRAFHHLEDLVHEIQFDARDPFGHAGHTHGNTQHIRELMRDMEATLHHLRDDLSAARPVYVPNRNRSRPRVSVVPRQSGGITIGNGRVQFRLGF